MRRNSDISDFTAFKQPKTTVEPELCGLSLKEKQNEK